MPITENIPLGKLEEEKKLLQQRDVASKYREGLNTIAFLKKVPEHLMSSKLQMTYSDVEAFTKRAAIAGLTLEEGLDIANNELKRDKDSLIETYRSYKEQMGMKTLDYNLIHKTIINDLNVSDEDKEILQVRKYLLATDPRIGTLLNFLTQNKKITDYQSKVILRVKNVHDVERKIDRIEKELWRAQDKNDLGQISLLEKRLEDAVNRWAWLEEREITHDAPVEVQVMDIAKVMMADNMLSLAKGVSWYLPKKQTKDLIRFAEDQRILLSDVFGIDPPETLMETFRDTVVSMTGAVLPGLLTWGALGTVLSVPMLAGTAIAKSQFTKMVAAGIIDKLYPAGYELLAEEGEGIKAAGGEVLEGALYGGGTSLFLSSFAVPAVVGTAQIVAGTARKTKQMARLLSPRFITRDHFSVREKLSGMVAQRRFVKSMIHATKQGEQSQVTAKMVLDHLVDEVEQCPKKWHFLGRNIQEICDQLESAGVKGVRHPKPSPELLYLEGLRSGQDPEIVAKVVATFGKTVDELDQGLIKKMQKLDNVYEKLFDHKYYKQVMNKVQKEEIKLGEKAIKVGKEKGLGEKITKLVKEEKQVKAATKKAAKKPMKKPKLEVKIEDMSLKHLETLSKKAAKLPGNKQKAFLESHGITSKILGKVIIERRVSSKFVAALSEGEKSVYNAALHRKVDGGLAPAVKTAVNHRVNNGQMIIANHFRRGRRKLASETFRKKMYDLYKLKKTNGSLVNTEVKKGVRKLRRLYKKLLVESKGSK